MAEILQLTSGETPLGRLDKELHRLLPDDSALSRSRVAELIRGGHVSDETGRVHDNPSARVLPSMVYLLAVPAPTEDEVAPEAIPLEIAYEDAHMLMVNKPAGMVVHPAPGARSGTLVAALLHHCGDSLSGVGGVLRPGIVHRIDKDTSGLLAVAKSDEAHHGLAAQFAAHTAARRYRAFVWGDLEASAKRLGALPEVTVSSGGLVIDAPIGRHPSDRKRMAVRRDGGKRAVTHVTILRSFGPVTEVSCRLETGRTHQIRVHLTRIGHPLLGDPVYGRPRDLAESFIGRSSINKFSRQALHAEYLGLAHPVSGEWIEAEASLPDDLAELEGEMSQNLTCKGL